MLRDLFIVLVFGVGLAGQCPVWLTVAAGIMVFQRVVYLAFKLGESA